MAILKLLVLATACLYASAIPQEPPRSRNTIFGDERLEGQVFEKVDIFDEELPAQYPDNFRLPKTTKPIHYDILWTINIEELTYSGEIDIDIQATQANVNQIILHSYHHQIATLTLTQGTSTLTQVHDLLPQYHFLRINTTNVLTYTPLNPTTYRLRITFNNAPMREDMYGIYKSWFRDTPTSPVSWMASTQFQSTAGRYAFPCYDEPSFKATFNITIRRPDDLSSWSCTRRSTTANVITGYTDDIYHTTPIMSTYLLAIIVADYGSIAVENDDNEIMYEVIARRGAIIEENQGDYAFEVGQYLLSNMSHHTAIDFFGVNPNLKMTQAAIPDFGAGAMENWGLLTYREAYLLYDENQTSGHFKQFIAYILSHEIAHMWFGNLVTCEWWDVLWLNEGFARYYEYFLTHWVEDYMGFETRFITEQVHTSFLSDSANNPHPLTNHGKVGSPQNVSAMFSTISYNKGACIIRMTEHLLGFEVHRQGLINYLNNRYFDVALPIHLFEALQEAAVAEGALTEYPSDFSVIDYYISWTEQPGVPVLNVDVNHQTGDMTITQRRFNINYGYSPISTNWIVPITFASASNPDFENTKPSHIIRESLSIINRGSIGDEWVVFNIQQTGYYRVNYDDYTWTLITRTLRGPDRTSIHEYNRAQIVNDVFQFARSGLMTYSRAFTILSFLEFETDYAPWVAAMTGFNWIRNRFAGTELLDQLEALITRWSTRVMNELTYYPKVDESFMSAYLRYQLPPVLCAMGVRACRIAAVAQYNALVNNNIDVPVDSRVWVYCNALREDTEPVSTRFTFLWNRFHNSNLYTEKITLLQSLGCTPNPTHLNTLLDAIVTENEIIRPQDYNTAFNTAVNGNEDNTQIVFNYIQNNHEAVFDAFNSTTSALNSVSARLRTEDAVDEFQGWAWANQEILGNSFQSVFNNAETSRQSIRWAAQVASDFENYFDNGNEELETSTPAPEITPEPTTVTPPPITEPVTPPIPDSAVTSSLSVFMLALGVLVAFRV